MPRRFDDHDDRLPAGISIIGYDSETGRYHGKDEDGSYWISDPGTKNGKWYPTSPPTEHPPPENPEIWPRKTDSPAAGIDPTRFSTMLLDPEALNLPKDKKSDKSNRSVFKKFAKDAKDVLKGGVKRMSSLRKTSSKGPKKEDRSDPTSRLDPRPGLEARRLTTHSSIKEEEEEW
ncbi:hypothetical protein F4805DRAFT_441262 [Annulohypoxylon moriforme]|nr:hypothetical protein F4805DRAFT_441262 [Annulohypoxylon moriforme]